MKNRLLKLWNFWPPFLGAGIRIASVSLDLRDITVELREYPWNRNPMGTHFGGSIYAMTDPFYAMMLKKILGQDYIVWDKAADIRFKKPGNGTLTARFNLSAEQIAAIKAEADTGPKAEPHFKVAVQNAKGETVAEMDKVVYVRRASPTPHPRP